MPDQPLSIDVRFPLGPARSYEVVVGDGVLAELGSRLSALAGAARCLLVADSGVPQGEVERAAASLRAAGCEPVTRVIHGGEAHKTWDAAGSLLSDMAALGLERRHPVVALGGGVVGDISGFVASAYRRGVPFVQCPTTLLAMVDASVGGKSGVNLPGPPGAGTLKNMAGAFYQPVLVLVDTSVLGSLPLRHLRAGLTECIKHAMLCDSVPRRDPGLLESTRSALRAWKGVRPAGAPLAELVARNVALKASVVAQDEREELSGGGRALLNLGHTFGHALETAPGSTLLHGEAVGLGLIAAATTASALGLVGAECERLTRELVEHAGLPLEVHGLAPADVRARMAHDKKVESGRLRLVLPTGPGRATVVEGPSEDAVITGLLAVLRRP
ncbi:MAG: 3-dehydroquinate synthase [Leptolyngbya sp. PLA1]|nr:3-dehydroquinate synthase [Leptolyngbya sp. PLA1]